MAPAIPPQWFYPNSTITAVKPFLNITFSNFAQLQVLASTSVSTPDSQSTNTIQTLSPIQNSTHTNSTIDSTGQRSNKTAMIASSTIAAILFISVIAVSVGLYRALRERESSHPGNALAAGHSEEDLFADLNGSGIQVDGRSYLSMQTNSGHSNSAEDTVFPMRSRKSSKSSSKASSDVAFPYYPPSMPALVRTNTNTHHSRLSKLSQFNTASSSTPTFKPPPQTGKILSPFTGKQQPRFPVQQSQTTHQTTRRPVPSTPVNTPQRSSTHPHQNPLAMNPPEPAFLPPRKSSSLLPLPPKTPPRPASPLSCSSSVYSRHLNGFDPFDPSHSLHTPSPSSHAPLQASASTPLQASQNSAPQAATLSLAEALNASPSELETSDAERDDEIEDRQVPIRRPLAVILGSTGERTGKSTGTGRVFLNLSE